MTTTDEVQRLKQSLLRCLRIIDAARPYHECGDTSIRARTFDAIPPLMRALELNVQSDELRPLFYAFNGLMHVRDTRIVYDLEHSGRVPVGLEDETYGLLNELAKHLTPIIVRRAPWWRRAFRKIWRAMLWLNGE